MQPINVFGIYVGNSSASIAIFKDDGKVEILANGDGERVTPAFIRLSRKEKIVGSAAVESLTSSATSTITRNKTLINYDSIGEKLEAMRSKLSVKTEIDESNNNITYIIPEEDENLKYSPKEIASFIFHKLYSIGESVIISSESFGEKGFGAKGGPRLDCVLSIPGSWGEKARADWVEAAESGGWNLIQIVSEASCALLSYGLLSKSGENTTVTSPDHTPPSTPPLEPLPSPRDQVVKRNILVYRLGGVSSEATIIQLERAKKGTMKEDGSSPIFLPIVLGSSREEDAGWEIVINAVVDHLAGEFNRRFHLDLYESRKSVLKLRRSTEGALRSLSTLPSCSRFVESLSCGVDWSYNLSRARVESIASPLVQGRLTDPLLKSALKEAGLIPSDIHRVILCGAPLKTPWLVKHLRSFFPEKRIEFLDWLSPDEIFARGAAIQGGLLLGMMQNQKEMSEGEALPLTPFPPFASIPTIAHPIQIKFSSGDEVTLNEEELVPCIKFLTIKDLVEKELKVVATQELEDGTRMQGEAIIGGFQSPSVLDVLVRATLEHELLIEAVDSETKATNVTRVDFKRLVELSPAV